MMDFTMQRADANVADGGGAGKWGKREDRRAKAAVKDLQIRLAGT